MLEQVFYYYNLNTKQPNRWLHPKITPYSEFKNSNPDDIRSISRCPILSKGGWHFSYFGNSSFIKNKLQNFSHQEYNNDRYTSEERIQQCIAQKIDMFSGSVICSQKTEYDIYLPENAIQKFGHLTIS